MTTEETVEPGEPRRRRRAERAETGLKRLVDDLHERREKAKLGGGEEKIAKQHEARQADRARADRPAGRRGTFVEMGIQRAHFSRAMEGKEAPADGVVTGWGDVEGRAGWRSPPTTSR